jgi:hypothetical protein
MAEPEKEEQPIPSRRAIGGESLVTSTAVGDERIFGWQPRDQPRPDEDHRSQATTGDPEVLPPPPRPGVLSDGLGQPDVESAARHHWLNWPDW